MKRNVFVDFSSKNGFVECQKKLHDTWYFSNASIAETLEQYNNCGTIKMCSPEHYTILKQLINKHLLQFDSKIVKEAYLASVRAKVLTFHTPAIFTCAITFIASLITILVTNIQNWDIPSWVGFIALLAGFFILTLAQIQKTGSPAFAFYSKLFENVEHNPDSI